MKEPAEFREIVTSIHPSMWLERMRIISISRFTRIFVFHRLHRLVNCSASHLSHFAIPVVATLIALSYVAFCIYGRSTATELAKDNSHCLVCHVDFESELIAAKHVVKKITCTYCHGPSELHMSDEMAITKPDILFGRAEVVPFCRKCHKRHKNPSAVKAFHNRWLGKFRPNGRVIRREAICTDCHGRHVILRATPIRQHKKSKGE